MTPKCEEEEEEEEENGKRILSKIKNQNGHKQMNQ